jgi:hypothetical protein
MQYAIAPDSTIEGSHVFTSIQEKRNYLGFKVLHRHANLPLLEKRIGFIGILTILGVLNNIQKALFPLFCNDCSIGENITIP